MAVDLDRLLELGPQPWPAFLHDLQGNILKGFGRGHTVQICIRFGNDRHKTSTWLRRFALRYLTSAYRQLQEQETCHETGLSGGMCANLFLSANGYRALNVAPEIVPPDPQFRVGMKAAGPKLNDPPPDTWDEGYRGVIHAMTLLACDDREYLHRQARGVIALCERFGCTVVQIELGEGMKNNEGHNIEHFGYVDGRSQPIMIREDLEKERLDEDGISVWNPRADMRLVLVRDPAGSTDASLGSYFVFRKLEQNVRFFKEMEQRLAEVLGLAGEDVERAGAMVVGRFEDGTPAAMQHAMGSTHPVPNNFDYADDPYGFKCPLQAHIRKTNPRGSAEGETERAHRIARRGIPYGRRDKSPGEAETLADYPTGGVGLLFMCFQSDLAEQFEFMQSSWANDETFPPNPEGIAPGKDPVIGQEPGTAPQQWRARWGGEPSGDPRIDYPTAFGFPLAVALKGGEYFFAPSISGIKNL